MSAANTGSPIVGIILGRERLVVAGGLAALTVLAWAYIIQMSGTMSVHAARSAGTAITMPMGQAGAPALLWLIPMWIVMMVAMMLPSAAPTILLFDQVARSRKARNVPSASVTAFVVGYLLVWAFYATVAAVTQSELHRAALLSPDMASASPLLGGGLLIMAGLYQWLPPKSGCLSHCRSPLGFFSEHWREGLSGAIGMGLRHGSYCVTCCWALMALLFVAGVMNLLWVAAIAIVVLIEKLAPAGNTFGRVIGIALMAWGVWVIAAPGFH